MGFRSVSLEVTFSFVSSLSLENAITDQQEKDESIFDLK